MAHLFSSLTVNTTQLRNRIVLAAYPSGLASTSGSIENALIDYYRERAAGGVGLILVEMAYVMPPPTPVSHLAIYNDTHIQGLRRLTDAIHSEGAQALLTLNAPVQVRNWSAEQLRQLRDAFILAAGRAKVAGARGVAFSMADGGPLHQLVSPRYNQRSDEYGGALDTRLRLPLEIVEGTRRLLGSGAPICLRLAVEESPAGSLTMHDSRVLARRLVAAGVSLIDITMDRFGTLPLARFPGWRVPLAASLKPLIDVPIMVGGGLDDPLLADSVVRDGSVDLVVIGKALHSDPLWPQQAMHTIAVEQLDLGFADE